MGCLKLTYYENESPLKVVRGNFLSEEKADAGAYRFGFNGQEKTNEIYGEGNSYTAEFWQYDARLGRRWNVDPKPVIGVSPYSVFYGNPIMYNDPFGDTIPWNRILGAARFIGGAVGAGVSVAVTYASVGTSSALTAVTFGLSLDQMRVGYNQMVYNTNEKTIVEDGVSRGLQAIGVPQSVAEPVGTITDFALTLKSPPKIKFFRF